VSQLIEGLFFDKRILEKDKKARQCFLSSYADMVDSFRKEMKLWLSMRRPLPDEINAPEHRRLCRFRQSRMGVWCVCRSDKFSWVANEGVKSTLGSC